MGGEELWTAGVINNYLRKCGCKEREGQGSTWSLEGERVLGFGFGFFVCFFGWLVLFWFLFFCFVLFFVLWVFVLFFLSFFVCVFC